MKGKRTKQSMNKSCIVDLVLSKYREDPSLFRRILPDLAETLDKAYPTRQTHHTPFPFGLTDHERAYRLSALKSITEKLKASEVSYQDAIRALEHCAVLTEDDSLPYAVGRRSVMRLIGIVVGKPLTDVTSETTTEIPQDSPLRVVNQISLVRGAVLNLSQDMRLVSISVIPQRVKEWPRAMHFILMSGRASRNPEDKNTCSEGQYATS